MQRMQIYLTDEQRRAIVGLAEDEGRSQADVIRRILDRALGLTDERQERLLALQESFASLPDAPDANVWLAEVRGRTADERLRDHER